MTAPATAVAPGPDESDVVDVIVVGSIGLLKVAVTVVLTATAVSPSAGTVETTVGATFVVKVHA